MQGNEEMLVVTGKKSAAVALGWLCSGPRDFSQKGSTTPGVLTEGGQSTGLSVPSACAGDAGPRGWGAAPCPLARAELPSPRGQDSLKVPTRDLSHLLGLVLWPAPQPLAQGPRSLP